MFRLIAGILGLYATYSVFVGYRSGYWAYALSGLICYVAAGALWLRKPWSQYLVYLIAVLFTGSWLWAVGQVAQRGWLYQGLLESVISLIPGLLMVSVAIGSVIVVRRTFRHER
jgi:hypothetical protein